MKKQQLITTAIALVTILCVFTFMPKMTYASVSPNVIFETIESPSFVGKSTISTLQAYDYLWQYSWELSGTFYDHTEQEIKADIHNGLQQETLAQFTQKIAEVGRTIRVNSINFKDTDYSSKSTLIAIGHFDFWGWEVHSKGIVEIYFTTDIAPEETHSPQSFIIFIIQEFLMAFQAAIVAHPLAFLALVALWSLIILLILLKVMGGSGEILFPGLGGLGDFLVFLLMVSFGFLAFIVIFALVAPKAFQAIIKGFGKKKR